MAMKLNEALKQLEALGTDRMRAQNRKHGAGDNQYGVKRGDVRKLAKEIKTDHALGIELWGTGNIDARLLAILVMKPQELAPDELDGMVRSERFTDVADWLGSYVTKNHPEKEALRRKWMKTKDPMAARAGWSLTAERIVKDPDGLELTALLDRIEKELGKADPMVQWTMNTCLAQLGIEFPEHRKRALAIGEKLGVFRDYPTSKGCTSPFAPIWINEMVSRRG